LETDASEPATPEVIVLYIQYKNGLFGWLYVRLL